MLLHDFYNRKNYEDRSIDKPLFGGVTVFETIRVEKDKLIAVITLNRPPANSINLMLINELTQVLDDIEKDPEVRVVVVTGAGGKGFCAGFDVTDAENAGQAGPKGRAMMTRIDRFPKPVIAAINGYAFGGGCELALACTFRVMSEEAKTGLTELNLGIIPGWGGTQRMPRLVGKSKALDLILFSKRITAKEAFEIGLVDRVCPREALMTEVMAMAETLSKRPPIAVKAVLTAVTAGLQDGFEAGDALETEGSAAASTSKDAIEGFTAFLEKRDPQFKGE